MEKKNEMKPLDDEMLDMVNGGRDSGSDKFDHIELMSNINTGSTPNITGGSQPNPVKGKPSIPKGTGYGRNGRNA